MPIEIKSSAKLVHSYIKALVFGRPGKGKTFLTPTAPKPILLLTEPGGSDSLSERNIIEVFGEPSAYHQKLVQGFVAQGATKKEAEEEAKKFPLTYDVPRIDVFDNTMVEAAIKFLESPESDGYETVVMDSASQLSKLLLDHFLKGAKDPRRAYGKAAQEVLNVFDRLMHIKKHVVFLAHAGEKQVNLGTEAEPVFITYLLPTFEGNTLKREIPHKIGEIYQSDTKIGDDGKVRFFLRTKPESPRSAERSRSAILDAEEEPHLGLLFDKLKSA